ncbi:MAG: hypothetical protein WCU00_04790 [Candidatus Latescibacterota bacterium]
MKITTIIITLFLIMVNTIYACGGTSAYTFVYCSYLNNGPLAYNVNGRDDCNDCSNNPNCASDCANLACHHYGCAYTNDYGWWCSNHPDNGDDWAEATCVYWPGNPTPPYVMGHIAIIIGPVYSPSEGWNVYECAPSVCKVNTYFHSQTGLKHGR